MAKRRQRSDRTAVEFGDSGIHVSDEDMYGELGSSDLDNMPIEVDEFSGISTREAVMQRLEDARQSGASDEEIAVLEEQIRVAEAEIEAYREKAIIPLDDGKFEFRRFQFTPVGLVVPDNITEDEIKDFLIALKEADDAIAWTVGDLANKAHEKWGHTYDTLEAATGYKYQTLADYAYVARQVDFSIRIENLKFSHHRVVASWEDVTEQSKWLSLCAENNWSVMEFKRQIEEATRVPGKPRIIPDELHRDLLPKFGKAESALKRALTTRRDKDVKKAREQLYQSRKAAEAYFDALEDELNNLGSEGG